MRVIISCYDRSRDFEFTDLQKFINAVPTKPASPFQIRIHSSDWEEPVLEHFDIESRLNGLYYIHYLYITIRSESLTDILLLATLLRTFSELLGYEIELFAKLSDKFDD